MFPLARLSFGVHPASCNIRFAFLFSHSMYQSHQPQWGLDNRRCHGHCHRWELLWWAAGGVWQHAGVEWGRNFLQNVSWIVAESEVDFKTICRMSCGFYSLFRGFMGSLQEWIHILSRGGNNFLLFFHCFLSCSADHTTRYPRPDTPSTHPWGGWGHIVL